MINLRSVDLNLLTVFEAVYEERSQIRAAQRLGMTQPAISNALSRLKYLINDPLFLGRSKGLSPTPRADNLYVQIHQALNIIREQITGREGFDPAESHRCFTLAISFGGGAGFGARFFSRIHREAPGVRLIIRSIDPEEEIPDLLREHRLDLAIHHALPEDPMLEQHAFYRHDLVLLARRDHPRIREACSLQALENEHFIRVHDNHALPDSDNVSPLVSLVKARTLMEVPNAMVLPAVVSQTDLIAITTQLLVDSSPRNSEISYIPLEDRSISTLSYLIWHRSQNTNPAHGWLRQLIMENSNIAPS
ncbi:MAG: hypothetical protein RIQ52_116 [Pseudomonadota bacterium]|jgi:DNA-binding transcriptional LysR family regulator